MYCCIAKSINSSTGTAAAAAARRGWGPHVPPDRATFLPCRRCRCFSRRLPRRLAVAEEGLNRLVPFGSVKPGILHANAAGAAALLLKRGMGQGGDAGELCQVLKFCRAHSQGHRPPPLRRHHAERRGGSVLLFGYKSVRPPVKTLHVDTRRSQTHLGGHQAALDDLGHVISPIPMVTRNPRVRQWSGTRMGRRS